MCGHTLAVNYCGDSPPLRISESCIKQKLTSCTPHSTLTPNPHPPVHTSPPRAPALNTGGRLIACRAQMPPRPRWTMRRGWTGSWQRTSLLLQPLGAAICRVSTKQNFGKEGCLIHFWLRACCLGSGCCRLVVAAVGCNAGVHGFANCFGCKRPPVTRPEQEHNAHFDYKYTSCCRCVHKYHRIASRGNQRGVHRH